jgi:hypothetical protein
MYSLVGDKIKLRKTLTIILIQVLCIILKNSTSPWKMMECLKFPEELEPKIVIAPYGDRANNSILSKLMCRQVYRIFFIHSQIFMTRAKTMRAALYQTPICF